MALLLQMGGLHHVALRVANVHRSRDFYSDTLGFPTVFEGPGVVVVDMHGLLVGLQGDAPETEHGDRFNPFRVGLDHLASRVPCVESLLELEGQLDAAGIPNNGIEDDLVMAAKYIVFYDPDGIPWELYATSN